MNFPQPMIEAVTVLLWLVIFVVALGLAEVAVSIVDSIVTRIKRYFR